MQRCLHIHACSIFLIKVSRSGGSAASNVTSTPLSGVGITVDQTDRNFAKDGTTPFTRSYAPRQGYTFTAPLSFVSGATTYLKLAGDVIGGWMLAKQALATADGDDDWSKSKSGLARVYAGQVLAQAPGLADGVMQGGADLERLSAESLGA